MAGKHSGGEDKKVYTIGTRREKRVGGGGGASREAVTGGGFEEKEGGANSHKLIHNTSLCQLFNLGGPTAGKKKKKDEKRHDLLGVRRKGRDCCCGIGNPR